MSAIIDSDANIMINNDNKHHYHLSICIKISQQIAKNHFCVCFTLAQLNLTFATKPLTHHNYVRNNRLSCSMSQCYRHNDGRQRSLVEFNH